MPHAPVLSLHHVSRRFGGVAAVDDLSLDIAPGEFFSLLGPSGCGKTTTLRLIAGFEQPDGGEVRMLGDLVNGRRPYQRPIGMVFQNYALFPHLDVRANVAFGLEERRTPRRETDARVDRALELVRLDPAVYRHRTPAELSGGQRQRVALARALVLEPPILLLDEPLGALDLQLRKAMQLELRQLNRTLGITFVLVTHDQEEALTMSDRVAVMSTGRVMQVGAPRDIYDHPATEFVATFIGEANLFDGVVEAVTEGRALVRQADGVTWRVRTGEHAVGDVIRIAVRPEWHRLASAVAPLPSGVNAIPGRVRELIFLGESMHALVATGGDRDVRVLVQRELPDTAALHVPGTEVMITWRVEDGQVLSQ